MRSAAAATSGSEPPYRWVLAWFSRTATNAPAAWRRRAVRLSWGRCVEHAFRQIHQSGVQGLDVSSHLGAGSRVVEQDPCNAQVSRPASWSRVASRCNDPDIATARRCTANVTTPTTQAVPAIGPVPLKPMPD
jgi:hypothetical protein